MRINTNNSYLASMENNKQQEPIWILSSANQETIDRVAHLNRNVRERAIYTLIIWLDVESEGDKKKVMNIPLEFLERDDVLGAIWYIITMGTNGNYIPLDIFEKVYDRAIGERKTYTNMENQENVAIIDKSLEALFRMAKKHPDIRQSSRFFFLWGDHEEVHGRYQKADSAYRKGMESWEKDAYKALAGLRVQEGKLNEAESIFREWYTKTQDIEFLGHIVRALCRQWKISDALREYEILKFLSTEPIPPFIIYRESIESNADLLVLEECIASYFTERSFIPPEALASIVRIAWEYIKQKIDKLDKQMEWLNRKKVEEWSKQDAIKYQETIFERLQLCQIDTLSFGNSRYMGRYLWEIERMAFGDLRSEFRSWLEMFLAENGSKEVVHEYAYRRKDGTEEDKHDPYFFQENLAFHVWRVGELYFHHNHYEIQETLITPMLTWAREEMRSPESFEEHDDTLSDASRSLKDQKDFFDSLRPSLQRNYNEFIQAFDRKYGVFYRRQLQIFATKPDIKEKYYPVALNQYGDIAIFFWVEKIMAGLFPEDPEEMEEIVKKYWLNQGSIEDTLLIWGLLFDVSPSFSISFLAEYPNMLDVPEALYLITEWLRQFSYSERKNAIKDLHQMTREKYGTRGFFDSTIMITQDILQDSKANDEEMAFALMTEANISILKEKEGRENEVIQKFITAGKKYGSTEWLMQAGDYYENLSDFTRAISMYELAFTKEEAIENGFPDRFGKWSIIIVTKLLHCAIVSKRFDTFDKYFQHSKMRWYNIQNYKLAELLWRGKKEEVITGAITMILNNQAITDMPQWTLDLLAKMIDTYFQSQENTPESDIWKVRASFIHTNFLVDWCFYDTEAIMKHWNYILSILDTYEESILHDTIWKALFPICGRAIEERIEWLPASDQSMELIVQHAVNMIIYCQKGIEMFPDNEKQTWRLQSVMQKIQESTVVALKRFPDSDGIIDDFLLIVEGIYSNSEIEDEDSNT